VSVLSSRDHQNPKNEPVFVEWRPEQIEKFGKAPFVIKHNLARHPLFKVPRLERLAKASQAAVIEGRAVEAQIKSVMLSFSNEASPDYEAILGREVEEVAANIGLFLSDVTFKGMTIIISARSLPITTTMSKRRSSAIDGRATRHEGYGMSQTRRQIIECIFGWGKQHGTMRKTKHRGIDRVAGDFLVNIIAYNLIRIPKLIVA
jgi:hypothetical protein